MHSELDRRWCSDPQSFCCDKLWWLLLFTVFDVIRNTINNTGLPLEWLQNLWPSNIRLQFSFLYSWYYITSHEFFVKFPFIPLCHFIKMSLICSFQQMTRELNNVLYITLSVPCLLFSFGIKHISCCFTWHNIGPLQKITWRIHLCFVAEYIKRHLF